MRIATYCITFPEEYDIIMNMANQAKKLGDVWIIDGGPAGHLCHHPKKGLDEWVLRGMADTHGLTYTRIPWPGNPGAQRNNALEAMMPYGYDWIIQNDSDELWPDQSVERIPEYLESLPHDVTNARVKILPLIGDEDHYCKRYAHYLTHSRIHRPGYVQWGATWHEHMFYEGKRVDSGLWLLHTNWLFEDRLRRIKGHGLEGWSGLDHTPLPDDRFGLTWPELRQPETSWSLTVSGYAETD
ncbi:MAG: glycosyltransferase family 2 protein [Deltaproteobacteria bacterium]|nr:glycosyltransferase family 2 protein [Deltaproteobacteria bacterium]